MLPNKNEIKLYVKKLFFKLSNGSNTENDKKKCIYCFQLTLYSFKLKKKKSLEAN